MKIEWAEPAELDLADIYAYIARDVPVYAEQLVDRIIETVDLLHDNHLWGAKYPKLNATMYGN
jgi:plasmid stabilization system protein ParE